jgi:hypothetical protein
VHLCLGCHRVRAPSAGEHAKLGRDRCVHGQRLRVASFWRVIGKFGPAGCESGNPSEGRADRGRLRSPARAFRRSAGRARTHSRRRAPPERQIAPLEWRPRKLDVGRGRPDHAGGREGQVLPVDAGRPSRSPTSSAGSATSTAPPVRRSATTRRYSPSLRSTTPTSSSTTSSRPKARRASASSSTSAGATPHQGRARRCAPS